MPRAKKVDLVAMERRINQSRMTTGPKTVGPPPFKGGKIPDWVPRTKVIVCGTRTFDDYEYAKKKLDRFTFWFDVVEVIIGSHGQMVERNFEHVWIGADAFGKRWAEWNWWKYYTFWPDWDQYGKGAGPMRNTEMAKFAAREGAVSYCIAFWDGVSKGTKDMMDKFVRYNDKSRLKVCRY